jgi:hypothetical protein
MGKNEAALLPGRYFRVRSVAQMQFLLTNATSCAILIAGK